MLKIFKYMKKREWFLIAISIVFIVGQVWLDLKTPEYMSKITRLVQTEGSQMSEILKTGGYMLACAIGSLGSAFIVGYFVSKVAAGLSMKLREKVYNKTMSFSMEEIKKFSTASLITRSTNDVTQVQMFVAMGLQAIIKAPIMATWAIIKISGKSWQWMCTTAGAIGVLLFMIMIVMIFAIPKFKVIQKLTDKLNQVARENLIGIRVIRAFNAEKYQNDKFENANEDVSKTILFVNRIMALPHPGMQFILSSLTLSIYWVGVYIINSADMASKLNLFSDMVVFSSYAMQVIMAFMMLTITFIILPRATVSARRINEVLDTKSKILDGKITDSDNEKKGEVEFKHVSFKYPDAAECILENISFTANKGETVAFIGSTGSGKSTLINLIPRFYDVTEGEILIDGINVKDYTLESLHNKIGYVSQRAVLFSGTVASNVNYGEGNNEKVEIEEIKKAVEMAQASEFVEKMDGKLEGAISQGGTNISGGQKQRLSIARAFCRLPEIYVFDDSFSALDYKTDRVLRSTLKKEIKDATTFIVAQRIGTIKDADKIIVLDEGKMVGIGKHSELLENCAVYREIAESQLSKEELNNG